MSIIPDIFNTTFDKSFLRLLSLNRSVSAEWRTGSTARAQSKFGVTDILSLRDNAIPFANNHFLHALVRSNIPQPHRLVY